MTPLDYNMRWLQMVARCTRLREFESATGHFDPLPERGIPSTAMRGCDMRFWKRTQRAMPRHNWKHLQGLGLTEGGAIVFLAVPREVPDTLPLGKKG